MDVIKTTLLDCVIIKPKVFGDDRGYFLESFHEDRYLKLAGIKEKFVQDNRSSSSKGVLRGLHFQKTKPQGKLVYVTKGAVLDVAVDLRINSPTFGKWESIVLSDENMTQFWIPPGFAHGFLVLSDVADFSYKCTNYYDPKDESGIIWNDPDLDVDWGIENPIISEKDNNLPFLSEILKK